MSEKKSKTGRERNEKTHVQYENHPFRQRLVLARTMRNLTQAELSHTIGIIQQQYNRYENGYYLPPAETLVKMADTLNVSIDWLMGRNSLDGASGDDFALTEIEINVIKLIRSGTLNHAGLG